jgi:hypothetical protein
LRLRLTSSSQRVKVVCLLVCVRFSMIIQDGLARPLRASLSKILLSENPGYGFTGECVRLLDVPREGKK